MRKITLTAIAALAAGTTGAQAVVTAESTSTAADRLADVVVDGDFRDDLIIDVIPGGTFDTRGTVGGGDLMDTVRYSLTSVPEGQRVTVGTGLNFRAPVGSGLTYFYSVTSFDGTTQTSSGETDPICCDGGAIGDLREPGVFGELVITAEEGAPVTNYELLGSTRIRDIPVSAVPVPASGVLLAGALVFLGWRRHRSSI